MGFWQHQDVLGGDKDRLVKEIDGERVPPEEGQRPDRRHAPVEWIADQIIVRYVLTGRRRLEDTLYCHLERSEGSRPTSTGCSTLTGTSRFVQHDEQV